MTKNLRMGLALLAASVLVFAILAATVLTNGEDRQLEQVLQDVAAAQQAALDNLAGEMELPGRGAGDGRQAGPGGEGTADVIPFGRRTKIHYGETSLETYGAILDYFGISDRFDVRAGATMTSERRTKAQVIDHALRELGIWAQFKS